MLETKTNIQSLFQMDREKETECIICRETFDEPWIQCQECEDWAHEDGAHIDALDVYYTCDICKAKKTV